MINHNDFLNATDTNAVKMLNGMKATELVAFYNTLVPMALATKAKAVKTFHDRDAATARLLWIKGDINAIVASAVVREIAETVTVSVEPTEVDPFGIRPIAGNERSVDYPTIKSTIVYTLPATAMLAATATRGDKKLTAVNGYKSEVIRFTDSTVNPAFRGHRANIWSVVKDGMTVGEFLAAAKPVKGGLEDIRIYVRKGLVTLSH